MKITTFSSRMFGLSVENRKSEAFLHTQSSVGTLRYLPQPFCCIALCAVLGLAAFNRLRISCCGPTSSLRKDRNKRTLCVLNKKGKPAKLHVSSVAGETTQGRATDQAASRWLPTAAARVRALVWSSGIYGGLSGAGAGFLRVLLFTLSIFIPPDSPSS
jgi:hypothetical protein